MVACELSEERGWQNHPLSRAPEPLPRDDRQKIIPVLHVFRVLVGANLS